MGLILSGRRKGDCLFRLRPMTRFYALRQGGNSPALAYVVGVMLGDGSCSRMKAGPGAWGTDSWRIELKVADPEFALAFATALARTLKRPEFRRPHVFPVPGGYWRVSVASKSFGEWWQEQRRHPYESLAWLVEKRPAEFLRGLYDSEGNLTTNEVRIFTTRLATIDLAQLAISILGLRGRRRLFRPAGTPVRLPQGGETISTVDLWALIPSPRREFLRLVGSSIERKAG
jgi:hypothetical protein